MAESTPKTTAPAATADLLIATQIEKSTIDLGGRYRLDCIQCIPRSDGGAWLIATDGRKLTVAVAEGTCDRVHYLPARILVRRRGRPEVIRVRCISGRWFSDQQRFADEPIDVKFPSMTKMPKDSPVDSYFPAMTNCVPVFINAKYLRQLAKSLSNAASYVGVALLIDPSGANSDDNAKIGVLVKESDGFGTLMAMADTDRKDPFFVDPQRIYSSRVARFLEDYRRAFPEEQGKQEAPTP